MRLLLLSSYSTLLLWLLLLPVAASPAAPETTGLRRVAASSDKRAALSSYFSSSSASSSKEEDKEGDKLLSAAIAAHAPATQPVPASSTLAIAPPHASYHLQRLHVIRRASNTNGTSAKQFDAINVCVSSNSLPRAAATALPRCCRAVVRDSATQASLLFTSSSPDLHPPASIQLCAHGGTSTVIPVSTDHSRAQQNAFQVFQSNQVCDSDEYAGRVVWDATDPDAVDATAALTASLFLSTAHQNSDANAASSTPILDISCHTPTSGVSGDAPLTTPPPRNLPHTAWCDALKFSVYRVWCSRCRAARRVGQGMARTQISQPIFFFFLFFSGSSSCSSFFAATLVSTISDRNDHGAARNRD